LDPNGNPYVLLTDPYSFFLSHLISLMGGAPVSGWTLLFGPDGSPNHTYRIQSLVDSNHVLLWDTVIQPGDIGGNYEYKILSNGALLPVNNNGIGTISPFDPGHPTQYQNSAWYELGTPIAGMSWNYASNSIALLRYSGVPLRPSTVGGSWEVDSASPTGISPNVVYNYVYTTPQLYPDQTGTRIPLGVTFGEGLLSTTVVIAGTSSPYIWTLATDGTTTWAETYANFPANPSFESNAWSPGINLSLPPLGYTYGDGTVVLWGINSAFGTHGTPYLMINEGPVPRSGTSNDPTLAWTLLLDGSSSPDTSLAGQIPLPNAVTQLQLDVNSLVNAGNPAMYMLGNDGAGHSILSYYMGPSSTPPVLTPNFDFSFSPDPLSTPPNSTTPFSILTSFVTTPDTINSFAIVSGAYPGAILNVTGLPAVAGTTLSATLYCPPGTTTGTYSILIQGTGLSGAVQETLDVLVVEQAEVVYTTKFFEGEDYSSLVTIPAEFVVKWGIGGGSTTTTNYRLRASCSSAPGGYIYWVNTTGDNSGQPTCSGTLGPTFIVDTWIG
jgi:hypothetical protein